MILAMYLVQRSPRGVVAQLDIKDPLTRPWNHANSFENCSRLRSIVCI
jgi:hypothetical protein